MKIITLCGSLRFQECMMRTAEKMALLGNCVLTPIYPTSENPERTKEQLETYKKIIRDLLMRYPKHLPFRQLMSIWQCPFLAQLN